MSLKKIFLGILLFLLVSIIGIGGYLYYNAKIIADEIIREKFILNYNQSSESDYIIDLKKFDINFIQGSVTLSGISITPKDSLITFNRTIDGKSISNTFLQISIDEIKLEEFEYLDAFSDRKVFAKKLKITHPVIHFFHHEGIDVDTVSPQDTIDLRNIFLTHYDTFTIEEITIKELESVYYSISKGDTHKVFAFQNVSYQILNVVAHKGTLFQKPYVQYEKYNLHSKNIALQIQKKSNITVGAIDYDSDTQKLTIDDFELTPVISKKSFFNNLKYRKGWISFKSEHLQIDSLNIHTWLNNQIIKVHEVTLTSPEISVFTNSNIPLDSKQNQPMLGTILTRIGVPFYAKKATINNAKINLDIIGIYVAQHGKLQFHNLNIQATNLTNIPEFIDKNNILGIKAQTEINNTGHIKTTINIDLASKLSETAFYVHGENIDLTKFNTVLGPTILVEIKSGIIKDLQISSTISANGGHGKMDAYYTNLKLLLIKKDSKKKNKFFFNTVSGIANGLIKNNNIPGDKNYHQGKFTFQKTGNDSFFKMLWLVALHGLEDSILGSDSRDQREAKKAKKAKRR